MRAALVIARRILRQRIRDRSAIVFSIVTPLGLALAFAVLIPNEFSSFQTRFVVVDADHGHMATTLVDDVLGSLVKSGVLTVDTAPDAAAATEEVRSGKAGAAILLPAGMTDAIAAGRPAEIRILGGEFAISLELARSAVTRFASAVGGIQLSIATVAAGGGTVDAATVAAAQAAAAQPPPISERDATLESRQASLPTFYGAAMAIMFVFFATQYGALALLADRQAGTMSRLLAAPISSGAILFGASLAGFVLGLVSMTVLWLATSVLQHASWGPPPLVILLVVAAVSSAMGISTLVASVAKTAQQAGGLNAIVAMSLSAIGGVFIPISQAPEALGQAAQITPHYWFLRGIESLTAPSATLGDILTPVVILLAIGLVTGAIGLLRARRALAPG
jgi:ABC-2 type transport system permease protein